MSISSSLPPELVQFVENELAKGRYPSESALLRDAVQLLRARKLHDLRTAIRQGLDDLEHGNATELDGDESLCLFFDELIAEGDRELARENRPS